MYKNMLKFMEKSAQNHIKKFLGTCESTANSFLTFKQEKHAGV
jgi:hypothetical protein